LNTSNKDSQTAVFFLLSKGSVIPGFFHIQTTIFIKEQITMNKKIKNLLTTMLAVIYSLTALPSLSLSAATSEVDIDNTMPSSSLYYSSYGIMDSSSQMIAPYLSWEGNATYCIGTAEQHTPFPGTQLSDAAQLTNQSINKMICAGYPYTPSSYGLSSRDYHYVTQMAIRCYISGRNPSSVISDNPDFVAEFNRIYNAKNAPANPTVTKAKITGSANRTTVTIGEDEYYRFGPYHAEVENGTLISDYAITLTNPDTFASYSAAPTVTNHVTMYSSLDDFYVYAPATGSGSTTVNLEIPSGNSTANIVTYAYTSSSTNIQDIAVVYTNMYNDALLDDLVINWDESGTPGEPDEPDEPEEPEPFGDVVIFKFTKGMLHTDGIEVILTGTSDGGEYICQTAYTSGGTAVFSAVPAGIYVATENPATVLTDWYETTMAIKQQLPTITVLRCSTAFLSEITTLSWRTKALFPTVTPQRLQQATQAFPTQLC
jgi:hypothetical protein